MSTQSVDPQQIEIERLDESELEEARDVPWPDWAISILKTLKANGYDPVDDAGEVDLGEAFKEYLDGIAQTEEQERKRMADVFAVHDGGNSITLHFGEIKSAKAFRDAFPRGLVSAPAPQLLSRGWQSMSSAPRDGTHILALLYREATSDMDDRRWPAFSEMREIWFKPYLAFGMQLSWHAGDPFEEPSGIGSEHMGDAVPIAWQVLPSADVRALAAASEGSAK
ncbi:hypothetical protein E5S70_07365 [Ensifer adhaerens]|uniref:hypothetical protein n=1 Tax=Ensifer canadensis TaxID=555315 RepID=UPI00148F4F96|nr:hypothetical protein [Ensifer canadensis]NOV15904.1 hypothetical protein [Ensifer canadensis]